MGGKDCNDNGLTDVYSMDVNDGNWIWQVRPSLADKRFTAGCGKVWFQGKDQLMVAGGLQQSGSVMTSSIEVYDLELNDQWRKIAGVELPMATKFGTNHIINVGPDWEIMMLNNIINRIWFLSQNGTTWREVAVDTIRGAPVAVVNPMHFPGIV